MTLSIKKQDVAEFLFLLRVIKPYLPPMHFDALVGSDVVRALGEFAETETNVVNMKGGA